jgi:hypothetical protein
MKTKTIVFAVLFASLSAFSYAQNSKSQVVKTHECELFLGFTKIALAGCLADGYDWLSLVDGVEVCTSNTIIYQGNGKTLVKSSIVTIGKIVGKNGNEIPFHIDHKVQKLLNPDESISKQVITGGGSYGGGLQLSTYAEVTINKDGSTIVENLNFQLHCNN